MGEIAHNYPSAVSLDERLPVARTRLVVTEFSSKLKVAAVSAATWKTHLFDSSSGITLEQAVAARGAVPGVWLFISFDGTDWIDGGMISSTNAFLAKGCKKIIILSPLPQANGCIPGPLEEAEELKADADVLLFIPDEGSQEAIGLNIYDATRSKACAIAGYEQGVRATEMILIFLG
jgi:NTE family protein